MYGKLFEKKFTENQNFKDHLCSGNRECVVGVGGWVVGP